jgi:Calx-beta domain
VIPVRRACAWCTTALFAITVLAPGQHVRAADVPGATLIFDPASLAVQEGDGAATVTVTRQGLPGMTTTVDYATSDGTATAGDYQPVHGTLTFGPDDVTEAFSVPIVNDAIDEPDETINLTLSSPSPPSTLGTPSTATITIVDDDPPPDHTAPKTTVSVNSRISSEDVRAKGVKVSMTPNEPASLKAELLRTVTTALASKSLGRASGRRSVTLKPSAKLFGHPKGTFKLRVVVTATDAAGNVGTTTRTISVKPKAKKHTH